MDRNSSKKSNCLNFYVKIIRWRVSWLVKHASDINSVRNRKDRFCRDSCQKSAKLAFWRRTNLGFVISDLYFVNILEIDPCIVRKAWNNVNHVWSCVGGGRGQWTSLMGQRALIDKVCFWLRIWSWFVIWALSMLKSRTFSTSFIKLKITSIMFLVPCLWMGSVSVLERWRHRACASFLNILLMNLMFSGHVGVAFDQFEVADHKSEVISWFNLLLGLGIVHTWCWIVSSLEIKLIFVIRVSNMVKYHHKSLIQCNFWIEKNLSDDEFLEYLMNWLNFPVQVTWLSIFWPENLDFVTNCIQNNRSRRDSF